MRPFVALIAALFLIHSVQGYSISAWYSCDRSRCLRPSCQCASEVSPLAVEDTPQFILLSNDDQVNPTTMKPMAKLAATGNNTNGCPIPVTWFTRSELSNCDSIRERYSMGDEFAAHAVKHINLTSSVSTEDMKSEILGPRDYLYDKCGLPKGSVKGYRAAYRNSSPRVRQILDDEGFTYDSTTGFELAEMDQRPFPFTMNKAIPDPSCITCTSTESYNGLWEVPLWALQFRGQTYPMNPGMGFKKKKAKSLVYRGQVFPIESVVADMVNAHGEVTSRSEGGAMRMSAEDVLKNAFDQAYNNNRAPVPIFVHPYWFSDERLQGAQNFIKYALSHDDVYFVTLSQLVEWMKEPIPAREMKDWLKSRCQNEALKRQKQ